MGTLFCLLFNPSGSDSKIGLISGDGSPLLCCVYVVVFSYQTKFQCSIDMSGFKQNIQKTQKNAKAMHNIHRTISGNSIVSETGLEKYPREYSIWCLRYAKVTSIANIESFDVIVDICDILSSYTYRVLRTHYSDIVSNLRCQENQTLL